MLAAVAILLGVYVGISRAKSTGTKDPIEAAFYGARTNFFHERTRRAAEQAFEASGTNAYPFLLARLKSDGGNGALYFRLYKIAPAKLRSRLRHPISGDDIKAVALGHLRQMRGLSAEQVQALADCVSGFRNPRLKMMAIGIVSAKDRTSQTSLHLCRNLLNDSHPGIQLEAAIVLANSAIASDPGEPALFPILLQAFESKAAREPHIEISGYRYQQQPPGGSGRTPRAMLSPYVQAPEDSLQNRIKTALDRLETHLTQAQKERLRKAVSR